MILIPINQLLLITFGACGIVLVSLGIWISADKTERITGVCISLVGIGFIFGALNTIAGWVGIL